MNDVHSTSGNISAWLLATRWARWTGFVSMGGKRVVLSWDGNSRTITLNEVSDTDTFVRTIFSSSVDNVTHVGFSRRNINLKIGPVNYDLLLRDRNENSSLKKDSVQVIDGATAGMLINHEDVNSQLQALKTLLDTSTTKAG